MVDYSTLVSDIQEQGFHICDNFLSTTHNEQLRLFAMDLYEKQAFKIGHISKGSQRQEQIRNDSTYWIDRETRHTAVQAYLDATQAIASQIEAYFYLKLPHFETHFAIYSPGSYYSKHIDQFKNNASRKISCVYYLNKEWSCSWGGQLQLFNREDQLITSLIPSNNRFICFLSTLPHEVLITQKMRISIAGWFKS